MIRDSGLGTRDSPPSRIAAQRQFLRFGLVGVLNTALDFTLFILFYGVLGLAPQLANALAFWLAASNSYWLNQRWTFAASQPSLGAYGRFLLFNAGGLLISSLLLHWLGPVIGMEGAKLAAIGLAFLWNFIMSKHFVFARPKP
ncbi:MAG: GtrA family protein [Gammaproteobacteria bacterium SHHR-1]